MDKNIQTTSLFLGETIFLENGKVVIYRNGGSPLLGLVKGSPLLELEKELVSKEDFIAELVKEIRHCYPLFKLKSEMLYSLERKYSDKTVVRVGFYCFEIKFYFNQDCDYVIGDIAIPKVLYRATVENYIRVFTEFGESIVEDDLTDVQKGYYYDRPTGYDGDPRDLKEPVVSYSILSAADRSNLKKLGIDYINGDLINLLPSETNLGDKVVKLVIVNNNNFYYESETTIYNASPMVKSRSSKIIFLLLWIEKAKQKIDGLPTASE